MTFGLLETICDVRIPETFLLIEKPDGSVVFTCDNVGILLLDWIHRITDATKKTSHDAWIQRVKDAVVMASRALDELTFSRQDGDSFCFGSIFDNTGLECAAINNIITSLATFYTPLQALVTEVLAKHSQADLDWSFCIGAGTARQPFSLRLALTSLRQKAIDAGWCPFVACRVLSVSPSMLYYAVSQLNDHGLSTSRHAQCTVNACMTHTVDEKNYRTKHLTHDCECEFLRPSLSRVEDLLAHEMIPVLAYDRATKTLYTVNADDFPFMAISHVWSDGLGSTTEIGLPLCQVEFIAKLSFACLEPHSEHSSVSPAFWIDSLCVPSNKDSRKRAIRLMAETYKRAKEVVVLDSAIRSQLRPEFSTDKKALFIILTSKWMQRVWTLQECVFAQSLRFLIAGGSMVSAEELQKHHMHRAVGPHGQVIRCLDFFADNVFICTPFDKVYLKPLKKGETGSPFYSLDDLLRHLVNRTTTKPEDETLAVASLIGVDVSSILPYSTADDRLRALFLQTEILPTEIIFCSEMKRMQTPPFRWAPLTLRYTSAPPISDTMGKAYCTREGLTTARSFTVLCFPSVAVSPDIELVLIDIPAKKNGGKICTNGPPSKYAHEAGSLCKSFNALIICPFGMEEEFGPVRIPVTTVAVDIPDGEDLLALKSRSSEITGKPLTCRYGFPMDIFRAHLSISAFRQASRSPNRRIVEGLVFSSRITVT